jgi:hypothetical protein
VLIKFSKDDERHQSNFILEPDSTCKARPLPAFSIDKLKLCHLSLQFRPHNIKNRFVLMLAASKAITPTKGSVELKKRGRGKVIVKFTSFEMGADDSRMLEKIICSTIYKFLVPSYSLKSDLFPI